MYRNVSTVAALCAACWLSAVAADPTSSAGALQRAAYEWNKGDYVSALSLYESLLAGPDAGQVLKAIALQTGELYRSVELTTDGANPVFGANGRFSYETGASVVAGVAAGADRVTHVRAVDRPLTDLMTLSGGDASFCPDGRRMAYVKITRTQAVVDAQSALAAATTGAERVQRQQELTRAVSSASVADAARSYERPGRHLAIDRQLPGRKRALRRRRHLLYRRQRGSLDRANLSGEGRIGTAAGDLRPRHQESAPNRHRRQNPAVQRARRDRDDSRGTAAIVVRRAHRRRQDLVNRRRGSRSVP